MDPSGSSTAQPRRPQPRRPGTIRRLLPLAAFAVAVVMGWGCTAEVEGQSRSTTAEDRPGMRLVATTGMIGEPLKVLLGDLATQGLVSVRVLMGPGVDPHLYQPKREDTVALLQADIVFANGLHLEGRMGDALDQVAARGTPVHKVAELALGERSDVPDGLTEDPHVWMDPDTWEFAILAMSTELRRLLPEHETLLLANTRSYMEAVTQLQDHGMKATGTIPPESAVLVTAHDAFGWFGARYDLEVHGIQGLSTESQAGVADIERLVDLLVTRKVPAVFVETSVPERAVRALIAGAEARGHTVQVGGELFSDAMGEPGTWRGTWIGMLDHNITTITRALGGEAPAGGMSGRLAQ